MIGIWSWCLNNVFFSRGAEHISGLKITFRHHPGCVKWAMTYFWGSGRYKVGSKIDSDVSRLLGMIERWAWYLHNVFFELLNSFLASKLYLDSILGVFSKRGLIWEVPVGSENMDNNWCIPGSRSRCGLRCCFQIILMLECRVHP